LWQYQRNCENLLRSCLLSDIFVLNLEKIADIEGFAELTAQAVVTGLQDIKNEFDLLNQYDFNLEITPLPILVKSLWVST
jgi:DNA ligase (NAD+)